jgi:steroid delta-isomerase-like uncharacterized protein
MSAEGNKALLRRFTTDFINTASPTVAGELIAPHAIFHAPGVPEPLRGPDGYLALLATLRGGFPDIQWALEDIVAEDDKVAARFTMWGTHRRPFFGIPPTGTAIVAQSMAFYRIAENQIVEEIGLPDILAILQQIGAMPTP